MVYVLKTPKLKIVTAKISIFTPSPYLSQFVHNVGKFGFLVAQKNLQKLGLEHVDVSLTTHVSFKEY